MQAEGIVMRCSADAAHVKVRREGGCGRCHEVGGCGGVERDERNCQEYLVSNLLGARPGDRVLVEVPEGVALRAAAQAYLLPLAGVLGGAMVAFALWQSDLASVLGGLTGLFAALCYLRSQSARQRCRPRIAGIISS